MSEIKPFHTEIDTQKIIEQSRKLREEAISPRKPKQSDAELLGAFLDTEEAGEPFVEVKADDLTAARAQRLENKKQVSKEDADRAKEELRKAREQRAANKNDARVERAMAERKDREEARQRELAHKEALRKEELARINASKVPVKTSNLDTEAMEAKTCKMVFRMQKTAGLPWSAPGQDLKTQKMNGTDIKGVKEALRRLHPEALAVLKTWDGESDFNPGPQQDSQGRFYVLSITFT